MNKEYRSANDAKFVCSKPFRIRADRSINQSLASKNSKDAMRQLTEEDARIMQEAATRFDEFIVTPEKTDICCPRCHGRVEQGRLPTTAVIIAARCNCRIRNHRRVERVSVPGYKILNQDDW